MNLIRLSFIQALKKKFFYSLTASKIQQKLILQVNQLKVNIHSFNYVVLIESLKNMVDFGILQIALTKNYILGVTSSDVMDGSLMI